MSDKKVFYNQINSDSKEFYTEFINMCCPCLVNYNNKNNIENLDKYNSSDSSNDTLEEYLPSYQSVITNEPQNEDKLWVFVEK